MSVKANQVDVLCYKCVCYPPIEQVFQLSSLSLCGFTKRVQSQRLSAVFSSFKRLQAQIFSGFVCALCILADIGLSIVSRIVLVKGLKEPLEEYLSTSA